MNRKVFMSFMGLLVLAIAFWSSAPVKTDAQNRAIFDDTKDEQRPSAVFTNASPITIVDHAPASLYPSTIAVSGLSGTIPTAAGSVKVTINGFSHSFPDDVAIALVGPTGAALLLQDGCGDDPDMSNVTYTLSDSGAAQLPNTTAWTAGTYKPTSHYTGDSIPAPGPGTTYGNPGPAGGNTATFASVFGGTAPNGNWNLYVVDLVTGNTGSISGGWTLEINAGPIAHPQHIVDFNGDGTTDFSVVRNTGGGAGGQFTWFQGINGAAVYTAQPWGIARISSILTGDYDGDHKSDITVWRPGAEANFYILRSSNSTIRTVPFGVTGDDPTIPGDYTGDGIDDPAVYRAGAAAGDRSYWYYLASSGSLVNQVVVTQWGQNGDFPAPGDYSGDGKMDFCVQRNAGGGAAVFYEHNGTGGPDAVGPTTATFFGTPTDVIVPGDYDGDGKTDLAVVRGGGGNINWYYDPSSIAGVQVVANVWGSSATDFVAQGDYDGDGKTDVAIWRPSATPGQTSYYYLGSAVGIRAFQWGQNADYPVANYNSH